MNKLDFDFSDFGHQQRDNFQINPNIINVNHSSYGYYPLEIYEAKQKYTKLMNANPEKWFRANLFDMINNVTIKVADFLGADPQNVVFTQNSSDAFNAVIKCLNLKKGDKVLISNIQYVMVVSTLQYLVDQAGIEVVQVQLCSQDIQTHEQILRRYEGIFIYCQKNKKRQQVPIQISSMPALLFPVKELVQLAKINNIVSIVDGAHGFGLVDLKIGDLDPDFYFTNLHKWGFCPRAVAILYVSKGFHERIHPNIISHAYGTGFQKEFAYCGTSDQTNIIVVPEAIEYMKKLGVDRIRAYINLMVWEGTETISQIWKTERLIANQSIQPGMVMVRAPVNDGVLLNKATNILLKRKDDEESTFIGFSEFDGNWWARFAGHIYNEKEDYQKAGIMFMKILNDLTQ